MQKMSLGLGSPGVKEKCRPETAQSTATSERQRGRRPVSVERVMHGRPGGVKSLRAQPARSFLCKVWVGTSNASIIWNLAVAARRLHSHRVRWITEMGGADLGEPFVCKSIVWKSLS